MGCVYRNLTGSLSAENIDTKGAQSRKVRKCWKTFLWEGCDCESALPIRRQARWLPQQTLPMSFCLFHADTPLLTSKQQIRNEEWNGHLPWDPWRPSGQWDRLHPTAERHRDNVRTLRGRSHAYHSQHGFPQRASEGHGKGLKSLLNYVFSKCNKSPSLQK